MMIPTFVGHAAAGALFSEFNLASELAPKQKSVCKCCCVAARHDSLLVLGPLAREESRRFLEEKRPNLKPRPVTKRQGTSIVTTSVSAAVILKETAQLIAWRRFASTQDPRRKRCSAKS